ncbi:glycosyltransferase [Microbacterium aquimaris]|uniref:Glycosyltransferase n=1 Tax=Microbacterium aquimaris TaxID=459816 RepID=A0ABU5N631_9MICO|nr:glycosyltransferase [Microbacterium aquimaris]MDZ8161545.1 glycosyltransferase [Microbacterium aquimaris]
MSILRVRLRVSDLRSARVALIAKRHTERPLQINVADPSLLRALTVTREPARRTRDLTLVVEDWASPIAGWRGGVTNLSGVESFDIKYDRSNRTATARISFDHDVDLAEIVRRLIGAFLPVTMLHGAGFPRIALDADSPDGAIGLLGRSMAGANADPPRVLAGVGLTSADVVAGNLSEVDPELMLVPVALGNLGQSDARVEQPIVDLAIHNPIGRVQQFEASTQRGSARIEGNRLIIHVDCDVEAPDLVIDLRAPLPREVVRSLVNVESISLEAVRVPDESEAHVAARFAELAATGAVLHSLRPQEERVVAGLGSALSRLVTLPYDHTIGMARERRSVEQRRAAMLAHSGYLRLADRVSSAAGARILPRVSIVLSTIRPHRVGSVLALLAAQDYPDVEIILALHGTGQEAAEQFSPFAERGQVRVISRPSSQPFGSVLADAVRESTGDLILKADDDDWYSPHVVWDLVLAHLYSGADIVGKTTEYLYFERINQTVHRTFATERYHRQLAGGAMMLSRGTLDSMGGWRPTRHSTDRSVLLDVFRNGGIGYRTHGLGYLYIRHDDGHTWVRSESLLLENTFEQWRGCVLPETDAALRAVAPQNSLRLPE